MYFMFGIVLRSWPRWFRLGDGAELSVQTTGWGISIWKQWESLPMDYKRCQHLSLCVPTLMKPWLEFLGSSAIEASVVVSDVYGVPCFLYTLILALHLAWCGSAAAYSLCVRWWGTCSTNWDRQIPKTEQGCIRNLLSFFLFWVFITDVFSMARVALSFVHFPLSQRMHFQENICFYWFLLIQKENSNSLYLKDISKIKSCDKLSIRKTFWLRVPEAKICRRWV